MNENFAELQIRFGLVTDIVNVGCYEHSYGGKVTFLSKAAEILAAFPEETPDFIAVWEKRIHSDDLEIVKQVRNKIFSGETDEYISEYRYNHPKNGLIWVKHIARVTERDENGKIKKLFGVIEDISEKKKKEEHLRTLSKIDAVTFIAAGIAHDFNNILHGSKHYIAKAKENIERIDSNKAIENLNKVSDVYERMQHLIKQLLVFSRGKPVAMKSTSIKSLLHDTTLFALAGSNIQSDMRIDDNLWDCFADKHQIEQVVDNLIINARQAMGENGKISITAENFNLDKVSSDMKPMNYVKISIKDNGPGISEENIDKIFTPFYTTKASGNGLGLASCNQIIKSHNGYIKVESEAGEGAIFSIYLPKMSELYV